MTDHWTIVVGVRSNKSRDPSYDDKVNIVPQVGVRQVVSAYGGKCRCQHKMGQLMLAKPTRLKVHFRKMFAYL